MPTKLFSFSLLLVALTGCGQTVAPPTPMYSDTCAGLFNAYASWAMKCLGAPLPDGLRDDLVAHCTERAELPGLAVAPAAFQECAAKIEASYCASLPLECLSATDYNAKARSTWLGGSVHSSSYEVFPRAPGTLVTGDACSVSAQCQSDLCATQAGCGMCISLKEVGEACGATGWCLSGACQEGVCVETRLAEGSACVDAKGESDCLPSLHCPNSVCVPRVKMGDTCPHDYSPVCAEGSICIASVCQTVHEVIEGQACDYALQRCSGEGLHCEKGICRRPVDNVPEGGDCSVDTCALGLHCANYVCVVPAEAGAPCMSPDSCVNGLTCLGEPEGPQGPPRCGASRGEGAQCMYSWECESGLYCELSKEKGETCQPWNLPPTACGDFLPCSGSLVCRHGECGPLDICPAP